MGVFVNPGNAGFREIRAQDYVDKSGLISLVNASLGTANKLTCVSRPRRFGKSFAAKMLCAYYDRSCDSSLLFDDLGIARDPSYALHLNAYNVIYVDVAAARQATNDYQNLVAYLSGMIGDELVAYYPTLLCADSLAVTMARAVDISGVQFMMILDEWDAPIRESPGSAQHYLEFLRSLFKDSGLTPKIFAGAYMTGILPIKKDGGQSAVSDFREYSVLSPGAFAPFAGFLEDEVQGLCLRSSRDFSQMQAWYDGYELGVVPSIYNPYAVMRAVESGAFRSFWRQTSEADALLTYIDMDFEGLQDDVVRLMAGETVAVDTSGFKNDVGLIGSKDDALTLMAHLGYLTYREEVDGRGRVRVPNLELRSEFASMLKCARHPELLRLVRMSDELLASTLALDAQAVAAAVARVHDLNYAPKFYNDEQALRHVVKMAYITAIDQYARVEELPSGHGLADVVYLPRRTSLLPALVVELKWGRERGGAIAQIKSRNYALMPAGLAGDVLLVGITYDEKTKEHSCQIETAVVEGTI